MRSARLARLVALFVAPAEPADSRDRSKYQRLALPHAFKPELSFVEAVIAAFGAFFRIFFGSLLFAVWGSYSLSIWTSHRGLLWRLAIVLPLAILFLVSFGLLMLGISALVRLAMPKRP